MIFLESGEYDLSAWAEKAWGRDNGRNWNRKSDHVILTGTPSGVILGRPEDQQDWLQPGDVLTVREDTIGELTVTIQDS